MNDTNEFVVASKPIDSISSTFWKLCGRSPEALPLCRTFGRPDLSRKQMDICTLHYDRHMSLLGLPQERATDWGLKLQKWVVSQFWSPDQDLGVSRVSLL